MNYHIKEVFYSLQGEGFYTGRPCIFCRFSGCNLWSGREQDRKTALCNFCDTDFIGIGEGGGIFTAKALASHLYSYWPDKTIVPFIVLTGGEPLLQVDEVLLSALKEYNFYIAIETNGTKPVIAGIDWICVSPKQGVTLIQKQGNELKLVYPQTNLNPEDYINLDFQYFYLQPCDNENIQLNQKLTMQYCLQHPKWQLSLQSHKILGIR